MRKSETLKGVTELAQNDVLLLQLILMPDPSFQDRVALAVVFKAGGRHSGHQQYLDI